MPADHEDFLRSLGQVIRQARKSKKMTQEDLSEIARVNAKYLGEVELSKTNPNITFLIKLSCALGMEMTDLFAAQHSRREDSFIYAEIITLVRRLDVSDLPKLHKILKLILDERSPV
jgi:transcriptional regulator with XRE-family HTH domain